MESDFSNARTRLGCEYKSISGIKIELEWSTWFELYCHGFLIKLESLGFTNDADFEKLLTCMNQKENIGDFLCYEEDQQAELAAFGLIVFDRILKSEVNKVNHFDFFAMHEDLVHCFNFSRDEFINEKANLNRRIALSKSGLKGASVRQKPYEEVKKWALNKGGKLPANKESARKLAAQLPEHLFDVSKDPARLIYETLLSRDKPS